MSGTTWPNRIDRDRWITRFTGIRIGRRSGGDGPPPLPPRPSPRRQPQTDPRSAYEAAHARARPVLDLAQQVVPTNDEMRRLAADFLDRLDALETAVGDGEFEPALELLPPAAAAARALLKARATEQAKVRQVAGQREQFGAMQEVFDSVTATYFNPNAGSSSRRLRKQGQNAGRPFKAYLDALEAMEQARAQLPKTGPFEPDQAEAARQAANGLLGAAQAYVDYFDNAFSAREQKDKANLRTLLIVNEGLKSARHFLLALDFLALPPPMQEQPWDTETELKAAGLRAAISFETGYKKGGDLSEGGQSGQSEAFWVEQRPPGSDKPTKDFLFKPTLGEVNVHDSMPPGSGALREALAFGNAKLFEQQTGISLGIPQTHVVTIGAYALDLQDGNDDGQSRIGSLQEFAPSDGQLRNFVSSTFGQITPEDCQPIMLHDIMALNFDRHTGNLLVQRDPDGAPPRPVPIDHGCTLPTREAFDEVSQRIGGLSYSRSERSSNVQNVMLRLPGAYEKLDEETVARLQLLDPEAMVQGMRDSTQGIDDANPGFNGQEMLPEDSLQMSKRSMMFLKLAASELSPAEIQIAIGQHGAELFDTSEQAFEQVAMRVIATMKPKKAAYQEILTGLDRETLFETLGANGWTPPDGNLGKWVMAHPGEALLLMKSGAINPNAPQDDRDGHRAMEDELQNQMQALDSEEVLRAFIQTLLDRAEDALHDVGQNEVGQLQPLRQEIAQKLEANDVVGAEAAARDLVAQAVDLALEHMRAEGEQLYAERDALFAGMGTNAEEDARIRAMQDGPERQAVVVRRYDRSNFDSYWGDLVLTTGANRNLPLARTRLGQLRTIAGRNR